MKKKKNSKKRSPHRQPEQTAEKGFDFGEPTGVMAVSNFEFVNALTKAEIVACGYGELEVDGFPGPIRYHALPLLAPKKAN